MTRRKSSELFPETPPTALKRRGEIYIGTSGFSFPDWVDVFYPRKLPRDEWLAYYAREFRAVEINATYYRIPPPASFEKMAEVTPDEFSFWVKVPGEVTHRDDDVATIMSSFMAATLPLAESGKWRGALAQFPNSFRPSENAWHRILQTRDHLTDKPLAVEFRNDDWMTEEVIAKLDAEGLVYVTVDLPNISGLPKTQTAVTGGIGYARLHGRNRAAWYDHAAGDRYDYDYSPAELEGWLPHIHSLDERAAATFIFFNNCHAGQAVKNARKLRELLMLELESAEK
jgi:uncharacterized protein YecE (DUF72 family)